MGFSISGRLLRITGVSLDPGTPVPDTTAPVWVTAAGSLSILLEGQTADLQVQATDAASYAVHSGSLPAGLALNGTTGAITGTASAVEASTEASFTIRTTDPHGNYADRSFTITIQDTDPHWASVVLYMPLSADTVDLKGSRTATRTGTFSFDNTRQLFGQPSVKFTGNNYLSLPQSTDWNVAAQQTIEFWVYRDAAGNQDRVLSQYVNNTNRMYVGLHAAVNTSWLQYQGSVVFADTNIATPAGSWQHVAFVKDGTTVRLFLNGVLKSTGTATTASWSAFASPLDIGIDRFNSAPNEYSNMNLRELRITKGVARYTANFTPPAEPFPTTA